MSVARPRDPNLRVLLDLPAPVRWIAAGWALAIAAVTVLLAVNDRSSVSSQVLGNVSILLALVFCIVACVRAARRRTPARLGWSLMALAMFLGAVGQTGYVVTAVTASTTAPSDLADTLAFLGYAVPSLAAIAAFPKPVDRLITRFRGVLDVLVITIGVLLVSEATILRAVRDVADPTTFHGLLQFGYPVSDIAICALVLCIGIRQLPGDRLTWLFLGGGLMAVAVTDSIYVRMGPGATNLTATPLAAGYMIAPVLIGLATFIPMVSHASHSSRVTLAVQLVPYVPALGAIAVFATGAGAKDPFLMVGGVALLIVVTVRQVMIVYENVTLTRDLEAKVATRTAELATFGSIVTSLSDAIVGISLDHVVTAWNPAAERLFGYRAADVLGRTPAFLSDEGVAVITALLVDAKSGKKLSSFEIEWTRPDGSVVPVAMTVSSIIDSSGVSGISIYGQDVTERRRTALALEQAREEALESSRLKSEFLATMSHEIRTPMNGVIGLTSLLLETDLDNGQRQYAEGVRGAGEALLGVINDILDFSKLEAGKVVLDPADFDPRQLVEEIGTLLAPAASAKRLELIAYCLPEVPSSVNGDPGRIRQILLNLASNAVKFTAAGEVAIRIRSTPAGGDRVRLRFEVVDTGIGIAVPDQARLFESFSQADASTTRRFGGTGLGLAISRRLVGVMGGNIGLESELGVGSTFWCEIELPVGRPVARPEALSHDLLRDLRVLVVDDNATNRTILGTQLRSWHMRPDPVPSGIAALQQLRAAADEGRPYDLAALDMMMPGMDGLELAQRITADPLLHQLPMIMLTSSPPPAHAVFESAGITQWLPKPIRSSELYDRLVRLMAPKEAELSARRRAQGAARRVQPGSRGQILVVEDNTLNQLVAEGIVSRLGFDVHTVSNGLEALHALEQHSYRAVLMDCHMPVMDGFTATREIRSRELGSTRVPIIAMTAGALPEDRERCLAAGMDAYISKPVDLAALAATLDEWAGVPVVTLPAVAAPSVEHPTLTVDGPPIDASRLVDLRELTSPDGSSLLQSLITSFIDRGTDRVFALQRAMDTGDNEALTDAAHELKGSAGTIGAVHVAEVCRVLETAARRDELAEPKTLHRLQVELDRANEALLALDDRQPT